MQEWDAGNQVSIYSKDIFITLKYSHKTRSQIIKKTLKVFPCLTMVSCLFHGPISLNIEKG